MNDGTEYAEMLKTMVSSCDVVVKPAKRRKRKDAKPEVIAKVNDLAGNEEKDIVKTDLNEYTEVGKYEEKTKKPRGERNEKSKKGKFDLVYAEGLAVFILVVGILLTNVFWEDSGINVMFKNVFSTAQTSTDLRAYSSFNAQSPSDSLETSVENGVMSFSGKGALYPVCDGKVTSVIEEDGTYTIGISHSGVFKTVVSGADFVYCDVGDEVFKYIPVCYVNGGEVKVYMYNEDVLVTNYVVENGSIVWSV